MHDLDRGDNPDDLGRAHTPSYDPSAKNGAPTKREIPDLLLGKSFDQPRINEFLEENRGQENEVPKENLLTESSNPHRVKQFLVDTLASVSFAFPVGSILDIFFTGLSPSQMLQNRGLIAVTNILTGGLYGKYRDMFYKFFGGENPSPIKKFLLDVGTNFTFSVPIYIATTKISGASWSGISKGLVGVALTCIFLSRLYGLYNDMLRRGFGLKGADEINNK